ncbi:hypothetical protein J7I98_18315 [Streptomyces sp. ISL-98]|uniref:hypothetical protein n=1 Tax=Streptomyces sp. ISL-98 TaxID=2819192 RepID=UPI001BE6D814|nr:hypothetical protein [Streptomyces sp. ISL-98]MBT2507801.1 hypothetical protein [Streptomyces sp. ISL-98]
MTNRDEPMMQGLPDGGAELSVVLHLRWDDVAALGREASRLAVQSGAPVSLDEAASHRLRTWSAAMANAPADRSNDRTKPATLSPATTAITGTAAVDRARPSVGHLSETASPGASIPAQPVRDAQVNGVTSRSA